MARDSGKSRLERGALAVAAAGLLIAALAPQPQAADEPRLFGRFFRFGNNPSNSGGPPGSSSSSEPSAAPPAGMAPPVAPESSLPANVGAQGGPAIASPRIIPRPRVTHAITESDPLITRITVNRSDDGNVFGMFLQVYADGTIIDSEGVHHVGTNALRPLVEALQVGDLYRVRGHCGAPATDYVESVQVLVYERSLGRLRAHAFSYSGNPQGCDNAIRHLHGTLDNLQAKITRPISAGAVPSTPAPAPGLDTAAPPPPAAGNLPVIPLTGPN